jgi:hypothetical protein
MFALGGKKVEDNTDNKIETQSNNLATPTKNKENDEDSVETAKIDCTNQVKFEKK